MNVCTIYTAALYIAHGKRVTDPVLIVILQPVIMVTKLQMRPIYPKSNYLISKVERYHLVTPWRSL